MRLKQAHQGLSFYPTILPSPPTPPPAVPGPFVPVDLSAPLDVRARNQRVQSSILFQRDMALYAASLPPPGTPSIVWNPGIRVFAQVSGWDSMANISANMTSIVNQDVNNKIKGFIVSPRLNQIFGPARFQYDGYGAENGFTKMRAIIAKAKSFNPPRDVSVFINGGGNGYTSASTQNPAFMSSFCPSYMNAGAKGSPTDQFGGGEVHQSSSGVPLDRPYIVIWNINVVNDIIAGLAAYNAEFGPDSPTGGIYRWDLYNEYSVSGSAPGYSTTNLLNIWNTLHAGARNALPNSLIISKPTFINPSDGSSYPQIFNQLKANFISMSCEDLTNNHDWGMRGYIGGWPSTPTNYATNNGGNPSWDFHGHVDPNELFNSNDTTAAIPPATAGSGLLYATNNPAQYAIWDLVRIWGISHLDMYSEAYGGPNINRRVASASAPPNPSQGPNPGSTSSRPNIIDVMTANTAAYGSVGVTAHGCDMAYTVYPSFYPRS